MNINIKNIEKEIWAIIEERRLTDMGAISCVRGDVHEIKIVNDCDECVFKIKNGIIAQYDGSKLHEVYFDCTDIFQESDRAIAAFFLELSPFNTQQREL